MIDIGELKELRMRMTPGPWVASPRAIDNDGTKDDPWLGWDVEGPEAPAMRGMFEKAADAKLIALLPQILDEYITLVEDLAGL